MPPLKIQCYACGQKLDVSELAPFTKVLCPGCQTKLVVPRPFGNYLLEEILGDGLLATVYRANDQTLDREVAVKILKPELARSADIVAQFMREARTSSAINHPNVVPIYSCGELAGEPYLIMQFMPGGSLDGRLAKGEPLALGDACRWFTDAVKGLHDAQLHGVLHHDVKPSNILLDLDGNVKVGDFGLVCALFGNQPADAPDARPLSLDQARYCSPERLHTGRQELAGDLYSLGATFYHTIAGVPPFAGKTVEEVLDGRTRALARPAALRERLPPELDELLMRLLAENPHARYTAYVDLLPVLRDCQARLERRAPSARRRAVVEPAPRSDPAPRAKGGEIALSQTTDGRIRVRRPPLPASFWAAVALLLLVVVLVLTVLLLAQAGVFRR